MCVHVCAFVSVCMLIFVCVHAFMCVMHTSVIVFVFVCALVCAVCVHVCTYLLICRVEDEYKHSLISCRNAKCDGLLTVRRLGAFHPEVLAP